MKESYLLGAFLTMLAATWLPRMLPLLLVRKRIDNVLFRSFLFYVPYAVLAALTIPAIFYSTSLPESAAAGLAVALLLGWRGKSLLVVALGASLAVFIVEQLAGVIF